MDAHTSGLHPNIIHPIYNIFIAEKKKKKDKGSRADLVVFRLGGKYFKWVTLKLVSHGSRICWCDTWGNIINLYMRVLTLASYALNTSVNGLIKIWSVPSVIVNLHSLLNYMELEIKKKIYQLIWLPLSFVRVSYNKKRRKCLNKLEERKRNMRIKGNRSHTNQIMNLLISYGKQSQPGHIPFSSTG